MLYGTITQMVPERMVIDVYINNEAFTTMTPGLNRLYRVPIGSVLKLVKRGGFFSRAEVIAEYKVEKKHCGLTYTEDDEEYREAGYFLGEY